MFRTIFALTLLLAPDLVSAKELTVYSARKEHLIKPIFQKYEKETGVKIKYLTDNAGALLAKLNAERGNSPADLLLTVDAGNLWTAANDNLLIPVNSKELSNNVPEHLRDPNRRWFGLSVRARTIAFNSKKVKPGELSTYEELGAKKWKGRLCLRTSKKVYNQSMVAMLINKHGESKTEEIVRGWVANLAAPPFSDDTSVLKAIAAGQCDVGIVNTYYFGRLKKKHPSMDLALFWPNQKKAIGKNALDGVHVNVSGAGILKSSKNVKEAQKFLEWLASREAQKEFAQLNLEYPVNKKVSNDPFVDSWGAFTPSKINVSLAGSLQSKAVEIMDKAKYK